MTQTPKKSSGTQPAAKLASNVAGKVVKQGYDAAESTRSSAENVVRMGSNAMKDFLATGADEAQKAQEKVFSIGRESAENFAKSADAATKLMYEAISISRANIEATIECGNMAASFAKDIGGEIVESTNRSLAENVELSKDLLACRTVNDLFELQNRIIRQSIDGYFNQSVKLSGMFFEFTSEALEPINERVAEATEQLSRAMAA